MRSVRRAERVVHEQFGQVRQFFAEAGIVLLLFRAVADVLQEHHLAAFQRSSLGADAVVHDRIGRREQHVLFQQFAQALRHGLQRKVVIRFSLGTAQMAHQDHCRALLQHVADRRQRSPDTGIVRDPAFFLGYVEVAAANDPLALQIYVSYCFLHRLLLTCGSAALFKALSG